MSSGAKAFTRTMAEELLKELEAGRLDDVRAIIAQIEEMLPGDVGGEMETAFRDFGIEARILSVQGPQLVGRQQLELPIQVREDREVRLNDE